MTQRVHESGVGFFSSSHVEEVCKIGQGAECCRYLVGSAEGMHCAKLAPGLAEQIDRRHAVGAMIARGDNCPGRPGEEIL
jgi:hypothetical protein